MDFDELIKECKKFGVSSTGSADELATRLVLVNSYAQEHPKEANLKLQDKSQENSSEDDSFINIKVGTHTKTFTKPEKRRNDKPTTFV